MLTYDEERWIQQEALRLSQGAHPASNIAPLLDLVRTAYLRGFRLVPMSAGERQAAAFSGGGIAERQDLLLNRAASPRGESRDG